MDVHPLSLGLLGLVLIGLPLQAFRTQRSGRALALTRSQLYVAAAIPQGFLLALLALVVWVEGEGRPSLGLTLERPGLAGWTLLVVLGGVLVGAAANALRRALDLDESPLVRHLIPRSGREKLIFGLLVAPTAGIVEELLFRGFATSRLLALAPAWVALAVPGIAFALAHAYQGWLGFVRAGLLGALLTLPFCVTGSVLPSIAAYTVLDLLVGLVLARWLVTEG